MLIFLPVTSNLIFFPILMELPLCLTIYRIAKLVLGMKSSNFTVFQYNLEQTSRCGKSTKSWEQFPNFFC